MIYHKPSARLMWIGHGLGPPAPNRCNSGEASKLASSRLPLCLEDQNPRLLVDKHIIITIVITIWLVFLTILKHMKISWDNDIPNIMESHESHVLNHQPLRVVPFLEVTSPCFLLFHWTPQFLSASRPYLSIDQSKYHPEIIGWFLAFLGYWNLEPDPFLASRYLGIINYKPSNVGVDDEHFSPGNQEIPWNL